jgi:LysR family nitrogen assimilation transcriptional regulator
MTLAQLANFVRIVELQSLSRAAAMVRIAQPALSRQVRQLEAELGAPLLVRHAWGVTPTAAGEALLTSARHLLREADGVKDTVHALATHPRGRVALGVPASLAACLLPPLAEILRRQYPDLLPYLVEGFSAVLRARLVSGELDMAVLYDERSFGGLSPTPLLAEPLMLIGPAGMPAPGATTADRLRAGTMILPSPPNRLRQMIDEALAQHDAPEPPILEVDSVPAIVAMVESGAGYTILPYSTVAPAADRRKVDVWPLEFPLLSRTLVLVRPSDRRISPAIAAVETALLDLVRDLAPAFRWTPYAGEIV